MGKYATLFCFGLLPAALAAAPQPAAPQPAAPQPAAPQSAAPQVAAAQVAAAQVAAAQKDAAPRARELAQLTALAFEARVPGASPIDLPPDVQYFARGATYRLEIADREIRLVPNTGSGQVVISFPGLPGANAEPSPNAAPLKIEPLNEASFHVNSIRGSDPSRWVMNGKAWSRLRYRQIQPGVDLVVHPSGTAREWEFDFELAAGVNPASVAFDVSGAEGLRVNAQGDLEARTPDGNAIRWRRPESYQSPAQGSTADRRATATTFQLSGSRVHFKLAKWDPRHPLVIDPSFLFSTYFGGSGNDLARGVATDPSGNVYICGATNSGNLPTSKASFQSNFHGAAAGNIGDAFLAKFTPAGSLAYVTYLGGSADDLCLGVAADNAGNVFVTGHTTSSDFPKLNPFQPNFGGGQNDWFEGGDAFIAKFTSAGSLAFSSYLGGTWDDAGLGIAVDSSGNAYVTGYTMSPDFPSPTGYQRAFAGSSNAFIRNGYVAYNLGDAFVSKVSSAGQLLVSTYLGGALDEAADAIVIDQKGNVWIGGATTSNPFPVLNGLPGGYHGQSSPDNQPVANLGDGFISEFNSGLTQLLYSTYLGGSQDDGVTALAVDSSSAIYAAGLTLSPDFPVSSTAFQKAFHGPAALPSGAAAITGDAFVAKLSSTGASLTYCTLLGGSNNDFASGLAVDSSGNAYLTGATSSGDFPLAGAALGNAGFSGPSSPTQMGDAFVAEFDPAGSALLYSSYLGGKGQDIALGLAMNGGALYIAGLTGSTNFPTQAASAGSLTNQSQGYNAFLAAIAGLSNTPVATAVTNVASYANGGVAPGEVVLIFGSGLGPAKIATAQLDPATGLVSANLAGTQVFFDNVPAPMVYTEAPQVAAVAPYGLAGKTSTKVTVAYNGATSAALVVPVVAAQPALFSANSSGSGQGAIYNQDTTANSSANPAQEGSIVTLFGTGQGPTTPALMDGELVTNVSPQQIPAQSLTVMFDNVAATEIDYAGPIPDLVAGFWQINVRIPAAIKTGTHQVTVSVGGVSSQANLTIAVQ